MDFFAGLRGFDDALPQSLPAHRHRRDQNASAVEAEPGDDKPLTTMDDAPSNEGTTADAFHEEPHGVLASVLNELDRPFQAVGNLLGGNLEGAARQAGDFAEGLVGHLGGLLPTLSRPEDYTSGHQILGIDPTDSPWTSLAADLGAGIALNPLTYTGLGGITSGYKAAGSAALKGLGKVAPEAAGAIEKGLATAGDWTKQAFAVLPKSKRWLDTVARGQAAETGTARAETEAAKAAYEGTSPQVRKAATEIVQNSMEDPETGAFREVAPDTAPVNPQLAAMEPTPSAGAPEGPLATPEEDYLQVRDSTLKPAKIPEEAEALGIHGVAQGTLTDSERYILDASLRKPDPVGFILGLEKDPEVMASASTIRRVLGAISSEPNVDDAIRNSAADAFAKLTKATAYPGKMVGPKFASGVEVANQALVRGPKPELFEGGEAFGKELPQAAAPLAEQKALADEIAGAPRDPASPYSGNMMEPQQPRVPRQSRAEAPSVLGALGQKLGGAAAETAKVGAQDLPELAATFDTVEGHLDRFATRLAARTDLSPETKQAVMSLLEKRMPLAQQQYRTAVENGTFYKVPGIDPAREMPADYVQRAFKGIDDEKMKELMGGQPSAAKARTIRSSEELNAFRNDPLNKDVTMETDLGKIDLARAGQSGALAKKTVIARELVDEFAKRGAAKQTLAMQTKEAAGPLWAKGAITPAEDAAMKAKYSSYASPGEGQPNLLSAAKKAIEEIHEGSAGFPADPESAAMLKNELLGLSPRGPVLQVLANVNKLFKPYAVSGAFIPHFSTNPRNALSNVWQMLSNPEARPAAMEALKQIPATLAYSVAAALKLPFKDKFQQTLDVIDSAYKNSGGSWAKATQLAKDSGDQWAHEMIQNGVLGGFMRSDEVQSALMRTPWRAKFHNAMTWPSEIMRGVEDRMRAGIYMKLRAAGKTEAEAERVVGDTLFRYGTSNEVNRGLRDSIPFWQYASQASKQQAQFLTGDSALGRGVATGLAALQGGQDNTVYPNMEGKMNVRAGTDAQGNPQFINGFGLPFESLDMFPNPLDGLHEFGREFKKSVIGASNPLVRSGLALAFNQDPTFETPYGSYSKVAGADLGTAGRIYNEIAGTGLAQAAVSPIQQLGQLFNDKQTIGTKLAHQLTGTNIQSVEPHRALQLQLQQELINNPEIDQSLSLYDRSKDPKTQALLKQYNAAKKKVSDDRKAAATSSPR